MARWDQILSLPVQSPANLEFCASELVWSKVEGWRDNIDRVALIPFARVDDFVRGESANKDCPTKFHVEARRRRPLEAPYKVKIDGILEYILYWCSFGPDDHRKGGIVRPSRNTYVPKKKSAGRPNTKRGCTCHFIVKRLMAEPSVALIIYNQDKHVDKNGLPCHGLQDKKAVGTRAMYAPYISEDLRLRIYSLLYVGVSVETIMQRHRELVEKQGGPSNRDDLLTHRYVRRQERSIRRANYEMDEDDAVSLSMWVESHPSNVFFYEDFSETGPFTIGIQTEWQLQQMIRFGNGSLMASDSRLGTHKFKYPVQSLLVFNSENKAIPVAWVITPRFVSGDAYKWMRALYNRILTKDPTWKLAGFIVDDPLADILTIRDVFQCSVLISVWRIRHAWHKNLMKRCEKNDMRIQMLKWLGDAVSDICTCQGTMSLFDAFMKDFKDNRDFMEYFKAVWYPRIESWIVGLQTLPLASQETSGAIELYHQQLNYRVLNEKDSCVCQRVDWLVDKLTTKVHSYFWLDEYPGRHDFARYWKDEWVNSMTSWQNSLNIPDSDVILEDQCVKVVDQQDRDKVHFIVNPGSMFSMCDCAQSEQGNLCEHIFKVTRAYREKGSCQPSVCLYQFKKALLKMLHCPPYNSLIRDHAVSLAAFLQTQLNAQSSICRNVGILDNVEWPTDAVTTRSIDENNLGSEQENQNGELNQGVGEKGLQSEGTSNEDMEVDPSSICASPSGLFSMHGLLPAEILSMNSEKSLVGGFNCLNEDEASKVDDNNNNECDHKIIDFVEPRDIDISSSVKSRDNVNGDGTVGPVNSISDDVLSLDQSLLDVEVHQAKKQKITCMDSEGEDA